ncbi:hypothetical protein R6Q59_003540 [Mikania micrantha]
MVAFHHRPCLLITPPNPCLRSSESNLESQTDLGSSHVEFVQKLVAQNGDVANNPPASVEEERSRCQDEQNGVQPKSISPSRRSPPRGTRGCGQGNRPVRIHGFRSIRREKKVNRYSPLLADLRVREFITETRAMASAQPVSVLEEVAMEEVLPDSTTQNQSDGMEGEGPTAPRVELKEKQTSKGFNFSRAINGNMGKANTSGNKAASPKEQVQTNNRFAVLEEIPKVNPDPDVAVSGGCPTNMEVEMDLGRVLPDSITRGLSGNKDKYARLSDEQKSAIMWYIKVTHAVPQIVANAWSMVELEYFTDQCHRLGYEPDFLLVDDESFLEDYTLEETLQEISLLLLLIVSWIPKRRLF